MKNSLHPPRDGIAGLARRFFLKVSGRSRYRPVLGFATGAAIGFYPGKSLVMLLFICACIGTSFGLICRAARPRRLRLHGLSLLYASAGIVFGLGFCLDESALREASASLFPGGDSPPGSLVIRALEGMPASDSSPTKTGAQSLSLLVSTIEYVGRDARGRIEFESVRIPAKIIARDSPVFETGRGLRVEFRSAPTSSSASSAPSASSANSATMGARKTCGYSASHDPLPVFVRKDDIREIGRPSPLVRLRSSLRGTLAGALAKTGGESAGFLRALLLGMKDGLETREAEAFKNAGCSHILALSGQHLSILASLVVICLSPPIGKRRAGMASILFAIVFVWIAGPGPSLLRSLLSVLFAAGSRAVDRRQDGACILALCFIAALPLDPAAARSLSFTLSHLAIFGLTVLAPPFNYIFGKHLPPALSGALAAGCAAQIATAPILLCTFGILVPAGLAASILSGPLVLALTWIALAASILVAAIPAAIPLAAAMTDIPYIMLMSVMETAAECPVLGLETDMGKAAVCAVVVLLGLFVYATPYVDSRI